MSNIVFGYYQYHFFLLCGKYKSVDDNAKFWDKKCKTAIFLKTKKSIIVHVVCIMQASEKQQNIFKIREFEVYTKFLKLAFSEK